MKQVAKGEMATDRGPGVASGRPCWRCWSGRDHGQILGAEVTRCHPFVIFLIAMMEFLAGTAKGEDYFVSKCLQCWGSHAARTLSESWKLSMSHLGRRRKQRELRQEAEPGCSPKGLPSIPTPDPLSPGRPCPLKGPRPPSATSGTIKKSLP